MCVCFYLFYFYFLLYCINLKSLSPTCTYTYPLAWTSLPIKMTCLFLFLYPMNPCNVPSLQPTCLAALLSTLPFPSPSHPSTCTHVFSMTYTCPTCFTFPNPAMHHVWSCVLQKAIPPLAFLLSGTYIAAVQSRLSLNARTHPLIRRDHKYTRPTRREGRGDLINKRKKRPYRGLKKRISGSLKNTHTWEKRRSSISRH